tara:strand:+ start:9937 stop:10260 length:324 start_codon:yes stop_codon:yes gene_type:complete
LQQGNFGSGALIEDAGSPENIRYCQVNSGRLRSFGIGIRGEVEYTVYLVVLQKAGNQVRVVDISLYENKPGILIRPYQIASPAPRAEFVDNNETFEFLCSYKMPRKS